MARPDGLGRRADPRIVLMSWVVLLIAVVAGAPGLTGSAAAAPATVTDHLRALQRIADANDGTRLAGTGGDRATQDYVASRLSAAGWTVRRVPFRFAVMQERRPTRLLVDGRSPYVNVVVGSGNGSVGARTARVGGRGCARRDWRAARHRVAVVRDGGCGLMVKARAAQRSGARALLLGNEGDIRRVLPSRPSIPVVLTGAADAERAVRAGRATVRVDATLARVPTANVIASRRGSGRVIAAGAHLDSVGPGPGINDNGSGVAALLDVAERLGPTSRPVTLGFWGAEELGLLGSARFVAGLTAAQRRSIEAYVNLDMVGTRNGRLEVSASTEALRDMLAETMRGASLRPEALATLDGGSDQDSFAERGIPSAFLFTGMDACYHQACDTVDNVDAELVQAVADGTVAALRRLAAG